MEGSTEVKASKEKIIFNLEIPNAEFFELHLIPENMKVKIRFLVGDHRERNKVYKLEYLSPTLVIDMEGLLRNYQFSESAIENSLSLFKIRLIELLLFETMRRILTDIQDFSISKKVIELYAGFNRQEKEIEESKPLHGRIEMTKDELIEQIVRHLNIKVREILDLIENKFEIIDKVFGYFNFTVYDMQKFAKETKNTLMGNLEKKYCLCLNEALNYITQKGKTAKYHGTKEFDDLSLQSKLLKRAGRRERKEESYEVKVGEKYQELKKLNDIEAEIQYSLNRLQNKNVKF